MKEGTVPGLHTTPALIVMMAYYLFRNYRIRGSRSGGVKPPLNNQFFLNISPERAMLLGIIDENENSRDTFSYQPDIFYLNL